MTKILTADDSAFMRKVLSDILVKNGYTEIVEAETGKQAVELYEKEKPDLVLLDIIMPEMDGISVIKELAPKGVKVLVISAVGQDDMINQAKTIGAQGYIVKPFEEANVISEIKRVLGETAPENPAPTQPAQPTQPEQTQPTEQQQEAPAPAEQAEVKPVEPTEEQPQQ